MKIVKGYLYNYKLRNNRYNSKENTDKFECIQRTAFAHKKQKEVTVFIL